MQRLLEQVRRFSQEVFPQKQTLFEKLREGQHPEVLFITCSDSRVVPHLLTQTEPGELFVLRNAGNLVPPYDPQAPSCEAATIEYAVRELGVRQIVVCGHSRCGAVKAILEPESLRELPAVAGCLKRFEQVAQRIQQHCGQVEDPIQKWHQAVEVNVLAQLDHLRTHPSVAEAEQSGRLELHGWVYEFESGRVCVYQPQQNQFQALV